MRDFKLSTHSLIHPPPARSFIHHLLIHSHSLSHSSITLSFILIHSLVLIHSCTHSLSHPAPARSLSSTHSLTHSLNSFPTHSLSLMHSFIFTHSHSLSLTHSTGYLKCRLCPALRPMHESPLLSHLEPWETNIRAGHD